MRRLVIRLATLTALAAAMAGCDGGATKSAVELTTPPSEAAVGEAFGPAVDATLRADSNSEPVDPVEADVAPVSYTTEPIAVPAN